MKCAKPINTIEHPVSHTSQKSRSGFKQDIPFEKFSIVSPTSHPQLEAPLCACYTSERRKGSGHSSFTLGDLKARRKRQSRHKLVIGNWNITSLTGKSTNWSRKPHDILRLLLASLRLSVVVLTLWSCDMGGNSSDARYSPAAVCPWIDSAWGKFKYVGWHSRVTEDGAKRLIHALLKQTQFCVSFTAPWWRNGSFQTPQSCQVLNRSLFRSSSMVMNLG